MQKTELKRCKGFNLDAIVKWRCAGRNTVPLNNAAEEATLRTSLLSKAEGDTYIDITKQLYKATSPNSVYDNSLLLSLLSSLSSGKEGLEEDLKDRILLYSATRSESKH